MLYITILIKLNKSTYVKFHSFCCKYIIIADDSNVTNICNIKENYVRIINYLQSNVSGCGFILWQTRVFSFFEQAKVFLDGTTAVADSIINSCRGSAFLLENTRQLLPVFVL